jgi:hypothetical protein
VLAVISWTWEKAQLPKGSCAFSCQDAGPEDAAAGSQAGETAEQGADNITDWSGSAATMTVQASVANRLPGWSVSAASSTDWA